MNLWKRIGLGILVLILILSGIVIFLISTDRGLYFLFSISSHWIPGLEIGQISGNWHNLCLKNITYTQPGLTVETDEFHLIVDTNFLKKGQLCINSLSLKNVDVVIDIEKFSRLISEEKNKRKINYSVNFLKSHPITLNHVTLNNASFSINDTTILLRDFTSGFRWQEKSLILSSTLLQGLLINLPKIEKIKGGNTIEYVLHKLRLKERSFNETFRIFYSKLMLFKKKMDVHLPFSFEIEEFKGKYLRLVHPSTNFNFIIHNVLMKAKSTNSDICLSEMNINSNRGTLNIIANMKLFGSYPVNIILNSILNVKSLKSEKVNLKIKGALTKKIEISLHLSGPLDMNLCEKIYLFKSEEISSLDLIKTVLSKLDKNVKKLAETHRTVEIPKFLIDITVKSFYWKRLSVDRMYINGYINPIGQLCGKLNVRVESFIKSNLNIKLATLRVTGNEKQHNLRLLIHGRPISGKVYLTGSFDRKEQRWRGQLDNILFKVTPIGLWDLIRFFPVDYAEKRTDIESRCMNNPKMELCIPRAVNMDSGDHSAININCFNLEMLKSLIPDTMYASGILSGKIDINWNDSSRGRTLLQSDMIFFSRRVRIFNKTCRYSFPITVDLMNLKIVTNGNRVKLNWMTHLTNNQNSHSQFCGRMQVNNLHLHKHYNLSCSIDGEINISNFRLSMNNSNLLRRWEASGMLDASLRFFGNIERPQIFGKINVSNININSNFSPFNVESSKLAINLSGMHSIFHIKARTKQGLINLDGDIDWKNIRNWHFHTSIKGRRICITMPLMTNFEISSDIFLKVTPISFIFEGYANIPWARIVVNELPVNIEEIVSSDVILLDADIEPIKLKSTRIPINGSLAIHIGKNVKVDAFGIKSNLIGDIKVVQNKHGLSLNGQISMSEGRFHSYGKNFIIRKGDFFFYNSSSVQPYISIEAIRNPETIEKNIIAGIRITGVANQLKTEIFSEPTIPKQDILSHLLNGQGVNSDRQDHIDLTSMIINFWTTQTNRLVNRIGETFSISNLSLDTTGIGDSSQLEVSGYVLPNLWVKYGVNIFNILLEKLTLNYHLMSKFYLEAVSGMHQSIDLIYRFKF